MERGRDNEVLTTLEACSYLRISRPTYLKYLYGGKIKGAKVGKGWKVLKVELDRFLKGECWNNHPNSIQNSDPEGEFQVRELEKKNTSVQSMGCSATRPSL